VWVSHVHGHSSHVCDTNGGYPPPLCPGGHPFKRSHLERSHCANGDHHSAVDFTTNLNS
jgi:hypothetical protein